MRCLGNDMGRSNIMNVKINRFLSSRIHAVFMALCILLFFGCGGDGSKAKTEKPLELEEPVIYDKNPYRSDGVAIAEGKNLFDVKCSQCHGPDAGGGPEAPDLTDNETIYGSLDGDVFRTVFYGTDKGMPTWGKDLGVDGIWKIIAYIESLKPGEDLTPF